MVISGWPFITLLILFPIIGALVCATPIFSDRYDPNGRVCRLWAISVALINVLFLFGLASFVYTLGLPGSGSNQGIEEIHRWMPGLGVSFRFVLDGISYIFCLLTALVSLGVIAWSHRPGLRTPVAPGTVVGDLAGPSHCTSRKASPRSWFAMLLAAEAGVMGAFLATDLLLFYMFYEVMLLPVLVGIGLWGGPRRLEAVFKFGIYTLVGTVLMLVAILYVAGRAKASGAFTFDINELIVKNIFSPNEQVLLGAAFLLAFAVKIPIVPFHSWLPDTYREAPHGVAAFVAALLGKVGIYGIVRFAWPLFPHCFAEYGSVIAALGGVGVAYGALVALQQKDLRLLLAYSSISHLGFCVLGLAAGTPIAVAGALFQSFSHGLVTAALFLTFGALIEVRQSNYMVDFGGLASRLPRSAFFLMVFSIAGVALPLTSSFVGEFMVLLGSFAKFPLWTLFAISGVVLGAVYTLTAYFRVMFGADRCIDVTNLSDIRGWDAVVLSVLVFAVIGLGIYPAPILQILEPAVTRVVEHKFSVQSDSDSQVAANVPGGDSVPAGGVTIPIGFTE